MEHPLCDVKRLTKEERYWVDKLSGNFNIYGFSVDNKMSNDTVNESNDFHYALPGEISSRMIAISNGSEYGVFLILLSGIQYLLSIYTGSKDVAIGVPPFQSKTGAFFQENYLIIRNKIENGMSFKQFLMEMKETVSEANTYQPVTYERLSKIVTGSADENKYRPRTMVLLENIQHCNPSLQAHTDWFFCFNMHNDHIECRIFHPKQSKGESVAQISKLLTRYYRSVVNKPDILLADIDILSEEKNRILFDFNHSVSDYAKDQSVVERFEAQVEKTPHQIAVVYQNQRLTYQELNVKANHIAALLMRQGIGEGSVVAVMVERSLELPIALLGTLKAGAAYLPINPQYPEERIQTLLRISQAKLVLKCSDQVMDDLELPSLDMDRELLTPSLETRNPGFAYDPEGLMFILYTSGTTGDPKGVMVKRHSFVNLLEWYITECQIQESDRVLLIAPISFDTGHKNVFAPLIRGGRLYLYRAGIYDYNHMSNVIAEDKITHINCAPSAFYPLVDYNEGTQFQKLTTLKRVIVGGETLNIKKFKPWMKSPLCNAEIINTYGPTECTDVTTYYRMDRVEALQRDPVPIGKPVCNTEVYILDENMNPLPIGVIGEICIGGVGLSHGYYQAPQLTNEKFVDFPLFPGKKVYKTGDLARWLPDGTIDFVGRRDFQVQIRGHRVELGEIEALLLKHNEIEEAVVVAMGETDHTKTLHAYVVSRSPMIGPELRRMLARKLPDFMIPASFTQLEKMPLSHNGKIDRKALPAPDPQKTIDTDDEIPENEWEERMKTLWEEVLGVEGVGVRENFFELGGHSLKAATIVLKLNTQWDSQLQLSDVFRKPTIRELARYILEKQQYSDGAPILSVEERPYYPVSSQQKRLFILWQLDRHSVAYNLPSATVIEGQLDYKKLDQSFQRLMERHESLRTSFMIIHNSLVQQVHEPMDWTIQVEQSEEEKLTEVVRAFVRPFDLENGPLFRAKIIHYGDNRHLLLTDTHHIVFDGISMDIMIRELCTLYAGEELPAPSFQYRNYADWQEKWFQTDDFKQKESFWLNQFKGNTPVLPLNTDYPRQLTQDPAGDCVRTTVDSVLSTRLKAMAVENETTLYPVLLAALNLLLFKYTGQADISIGTPTAGRSRPGLEQVIGMFVNTVVIRNFPNNDKTYRQFLSEVKERVLLAIDHEEYPFDMLVDQLGVSRDTGRNPLFDVMFSLENDEDLTINGEGLTFRPFPADSVETQFDLSVHGYISEDGIQFKWSYRKSLFSRGTVEGMAQHYLRLLQGITEKPDTPMQGIQMLSEEEKQRVIHVFNETGVDYPTSFTIQQLILRQVKQTPSEPAVIHEGRALTYAQLHAKSNQIARMLRKKGLKRNELVGVATEYSFDMITGILGVLKAGGAYLPIDPDLPAGRIAYMVGDSDCNRIVTQQRFMERFNLTADLISLDDEIICRESEEDLDNINDADDLAYVIYTSGTTGNPKGVMIHHRNVVNQLMGLVDRFSFKPDFHHLLTAKFTFDVSVQQLLLPLLSGGKLFIPRKETMMEPRELWDFIVENRIDVLDMVPSQMKMLLHHLHGDHPFRYIILAGEVLTKNLYENIRSVAHVDQIVNIYGPTETTINATAYMCDGREKGNSLPIGKPLPNYRTYILAPDLSPVPIGVTGEIFIAGAGVGGGYLNNPEETQQRFVPDPFVPDQTMYKTGDLARWLPDGNIDYIGRLDHQVKIHGVRVEPDEITQILLSHDSIRDAVVIDKQNEEGQSYLCAYVCKNKNVTTAELREHLKNDLPDYMIPSFIIGLDKLPLTENGKIDRKSLQARTPERNQLSGTNYLAPATDVEKTIAAIWKEILGVERVGVHDPFFELGGNSLKIIQVNERLKEELTINLPVVDLFRYNTIASLVRQISRNHDTRRPGYAGADRREVLEQSKKRLDQRRKRKRDRHEP